MQVHAIEPSDHSDWVSIHNRLPNKKAYARARCSPTYILLSEIVNKIITSAIAAAMILNNDITLILLFYFKLLISVLLNTEGPQEI